MLAAASTAPGPSRDRLAITGRCLLPAGVQASPLRDGRALPEYRRSLDFVGIVRVLVGSQNQTVGVGSLNFMCFQTVGTNLLTLSNTELFFIEIEIFLTKILCKDFEFLES